MSMFPVNAKEARFQTEMLYPYGTDCVVIMVPKQSQLHHFLQKLIKEPDIQSVCIVLMLFVIARILIEKSHWSQWIGICIESLGTFLSQVKSAKRNSIAKAWDINLRGFSVFAVVTLSVIIFKNLMNKEYVEIDKVDELIASNLTIQAQDYFAYDTTFLANLK